MSLLGLNTRYKNTATFIGSRKVLQFALWEPFTDLATLDDADYDVYRCTAGDVGFLDRVAIQFYGNGTEWAWWIIAYVNGIVDPELEMFSGMVLKIPPATAVRAFSVSQVKLPTVL